MKRVLLMLVVIVSIMSACNVSPAKVNDPNASVPFNEEKAYQNLTGLGLQGREALAVIETMKYTAETRSYNNYLYKLDGLDTTVGVSCAIEPTQSSVSEINLIDYLGLGNRHTYISSSNDNYMYSKRKVVFLGRGLVEGKDVYAEAHYQVLNAIASFQYVNLYQIRDDSIALMGTVEGGEVEYRTRFTEEKHPLIMNIGQEYSFAESDDKLGLYGKSYHEILGFKDVTVGENYFGGCVQYREIRMFNTSAGTGAVSILNKYLFRDLGPVLMELTQVFISGATDKYVSVSKGYESCLIESTPYTQVSKGEDIYPFVSFEEPSYEQTYDATSVNEEFIAAIRRRDHARILECLRLGADPNWFFPDDIGFRYEKPLFFAIGNNDLDTVKILVENSASLWYLDAAVLNGYYDIADYLLAQGADVNLLQGEGSDMMPPLMWAALKGNLEAVQYLLHNGANPNIEVPLPNVGPGSYSALYLAEMNGHTEVAELIRQAGGE